MTREEGLVRRNHLNEAPFDVTISFEVEKELVIEPMLRNRLSKTQKNNIWTQKIALVGLIKNTKPQRYLRKESKALMP